MRYQDKLRYLSAALALLLLAWGLGEFFAPERSAARSETGVLLPGKPAGLGSISLGAGNSRLELVKEGGSWLVAEGGDRLPAQVSRVEALLAVLGDSGRRRPVAAKKEAWKELGLEEGTAKYLKVTDPSGRALTELWAGNRSPTGSGLYVRFAGSDSSFTIDAVLASYLSADRSSWLDRRLFHGAVEAASAQSIAVRANLALEAPPAKPLRVDWRLLRSGEGWKGASRDLDAVAVEALLRAFLNLEAVDLAARAPAGVFDAVSATIDVDLGKGTSRRVEVGAPAGEGRFWAKALDSGQASPLAFQVSSYSLGTIIKDEAAFARK